MGESVGVRHRALVDIRVMMLQQLQVDICLCGVGRGDGCDKVPELVVGRR